MLENFYFLSLILELKENPKFLLYLKGYFFFRLIFFIGRFK